MTSENKFRKNYGRIDVKIFSKTFTAWFKEKYILTKPFCQNSVCHSQCVARNLASGPSTPESFEIVCIAESVESGKQTLC